MKGRLLLANLIPTIRQGGALLLLPSAGLPLPDETSALSVEMQTVGA